MNANDNALPEVTEAATATPTPLDDEEPFVPQGGGPLLTLAPEDYPDVSHLITEDGAPMDNIYVERQGRLLTDPLDNSWEGPSEDAPIVTLTNVGLFGGLYEPSLAPDFLLSLGVALPADLHKKEHRSYLPDVVGEIVSDRRGEEETLKFRAYARLGIKYYFIYDPNNRLGNGVLRVYGLHPEGYDLIPDNWLAAVGLGLTLWQGKYAGAEGTWLRWCYRDGRVVPTAGERIWQEKQRADQEKQRADQEKQRADQEKQRADQEIERRQRLEAQLRALGIEPSA